MGKNIICYPLKPKKGSEWNNEELRHSLRSVDRHWKGEFDEVYILGAYMPQWINEEEVQFKMAPRYGDALSAAYELAGEGGNILWMNDDIMFMKDTSWEDMVKPARRERTKQMTVEAATRWSESSNGWEMRLGKIMLSLHERGATTWKFSTHTPYWYEADKFKQCLDEFLSLGYKVAIENAYYNLFLDEFGQTPIVDKFRSGHKNPRFPMHRIQDVRFLNLTPRISPWMKGFIRGHWAYPCRFEKP